VKYAEALQARRLSTSRRELVRLAANVDTRQFATYLHAHGAADGVNYEVNSTTFGGLRTAFSVPAEHTEAVIVILTFDDVFPELGYRSMELWTQEQVMGCLAEAPRRIEEFCIWLTAELSRWKGGPAVVVPPLIQPPPLIAAPPTRATVLHAASLRLQVTLLDHLVALARVFLLDASAVMQGLTTTQLQSAGSWLHTGTPLSLAASDRLAAAAHRLLARRPAPKKVLVTDLDDTLWQGVLGDDGPAGISSHPDGPGWIHHVYQGVLSLLRSQGTLLAICSRGDLDGLCDFASDPKQRERAGVRLPLEAFSATRCSLQRKSSMLLEIAGELGVGLEAFVFVDDNRVELAEVRAELPAVTVLRFPRPAELDSFVGALRELFAGDQTEEDLRRADLYEIRGRAERERAGHQTLDDFLRWLDMVAEFDVVTSEAAARPLQLLNKTNQFNLTGERLTDTAWQSYFYGNGRCCVQGRLRDRHGDHGIVLVGLVQIDAESIAIENLAVSCRVLNRGFETAFLDWLVRRFPDVSKIEACWNATGRNTIAREWLTAHGFAAGRNPERFVLAPGTGGFVLPRHYVALEDRAAPAGGDA
jgi:FkbH-like protein